MKQIKTYKFKLCPNQEQQALITRTFGCCRLVFNYSLAKQNDKDNMWRIVQQMVDNGQLKRTTGRVNFLTKIKPLRLKM
ncbi:MAG: helix-turn-helix domain-containing protein [Culicoidibacterales bacterium]